MEFADVFYWKTFLGPPLLTFGATYGIFSQWIVRHAHPFHHPHTHCTIKAIHNHQNTSNRAAVVSFEMSAKLATDVY